MKIRRIFSCIMGFCSFLTIGGVAATWNYAGFDAKPFDSEINLEMDWVYLPEGDDTVHVGLSYTGLVEVVLNDLKYGINPNGTIVKAFDDKKLLEKGIVHSVQNNLSFGNLKNVLAAANSQHLQFTITHRQGTNPMEYDLYMYEVVHSTGEIVGVYCAYLKKLDCVLEL